MKMPVETWGKRHREKKGPNPSIGVYLQKPRPEKVLKGPVKFRKIKAPNFTERLQTGPRKIAVAEEQFFSDIVNELINRTSMFSNWTINAAMGLIAASNRDIDGLQSVRHFWHVSESDTVTTRKPP